MTATATDKRSIPSLDGLRALSIALVVASHVVVRLGMPEWAERWLDSGSLGVQVFFVISGFLITTLLLRELDRSGRIHLGRFYFRRVLRIFPAYYTYLGVIALLGAAGLIASAGIRWIPAITYTSDIFIRHQSWLVGHGWSLSVEEQFYVCWPICLVLLGRRGALKAAVAVLVLSPFIRLAILAITRDAALAGIPEFDAIAAGCVLAILWPRLQRDERFVALLRSRAFVLVPLSSWVVSALFTHQIRWLFVGDILFARTWVAIGLALTIAWCMLNATSAVGRALNTAPMRAVGVLSYSLYLWQQLFVWERFPLSLWAAPLAALLAAMASYVLVERPGLRLRERLESRLQLFTEARMPDPLPAPSEAAA